MRSLLPVFALVTLLASPAAAVPMKSALAVDGTARGFTITFRLDGAEALTVCAANPWEISGRRDAVVNEEIFSDANATFAFQTGPGASECGAFPTCAPMLFDVFAVEAELGPGPDLGAFGTRTDLIAPPATATSPTER